MNRALLSFVFLVLSSLACALNLDNTPPAPVKPSFTTPLTTPTTVLSANVTAQRSLNVRAGPSRTYAVIGALYFGERAELTGVCRQGWAKITWKDGIAWVYSSYLSDNSCKETTK